jgi:hypothetical protein
MAIARLMFYGRSGLSGFCVDCFEFFWGLFEADVSERRLGIRKANRGGFLTTWSNYSRIRNWIDSGRGIHV